MFPYWTAYLLVSLIALPKLKVARFGWLLIGLALTIFIGLRYEVGGDWYNYLGYFYRIQGLSFLQIFAFKAPGYQVVNWVSYQVGTGLWGVNLLMAAMFSWGLIRFVRRLPDPRVALVAAIPYMVIVVAMGYTRQAAALGLIMAGITYLLDHRLVIFVLILSVAATLHQSAVIMVPFAILANSRNRVLSGLSIIFASVLLYFLLLQDNVDSLWGTYVDSSYSQESSGGPIRVIMNVLPACLFLFYRERFEMSAEERRLWVWVSIAAVACLPVVFIAPTAVDRVALYLIPVQLVVASHLPQLTRRDSRVWSRGVVVLVYASVMFVWLNFAGHRENWLPYQLWFLATR